MSRDFSKEDEGESKWHRIESSRHLMKLCRIPALCYIICCLVNSKFATDSRLTGMYQEMLKLFILRHSTNSDERERTLKELILTKRLENLVPSPWEPINLSGDFLQDYLEKLGVKRFEQLVRLSDDEQIITDDDVPPNDIMNYRLPFPFLVEFLAAMNLINNYKDREIKNVSNNLVQDTSNHLFLQFVAGLINSDCYPETVMKFFQLLNSNIHARSSGEFSKRISLVAMKCLYELDNWTNVVDISKYSYFEQLSINICNLDVSPVDCTVIADFLSRLDNPVESLNLSSNHTISDNGISELAKLVDLKAVNFPKELDISGCNVGDKGLKVLMAATLKENCNLITLKVEQNTHITENGIGDLCTALRHDNCKIQKLKLYGIALNKQSVKNICNALQAEGSKLLELKANFDGEFKSIADGNFKELSAGTVRFRRRIFAPEQQDNLEPSTTSAIDTERLITVEDERSEVDFISPIVKESPLFKALTDYKSHQQLEVLGLNGNHITDNGLLLLCEIIKHRRCLLKEVHLKDNSITDKGLIALLDSLTRYECSLGILHLGSNLISLCRKEVLSSLSESFENKNFKLKKFILTENPIIPYRTKRELLLKSKPEGLGIDI